MGQKLTLNIAEKGFPISVYNRTTSKVDETLDRAHREGQLPLSGHYNPKDFVLSIKKPRSIIILVKVGEPIDQTIAALPAHMEPGDTIIDGSNPELYKLNRIPILIHTRLIPDFQFLILQIEFSFFGLNFCFPTRKTRVFLIDGFLVEENLVTIMHHTSELPNAHKNTWFALKFSINVEVHTFVTST